jgi:hypothetical protein
MFVIIRTENAGCFAGELADGNRFETNGENREVILRDARRLWYWDGAASLSQLAVDGTSKPDKCRFPTPVPSVLLTQVIEVIECTEQARQSIHDVPVWTA